MFSSGVQDGAVPILMDNASGSLNARLERIERQVQEALNASNASNAAASRAPSDSTARYLAPLSGKCGDN
jgi:hypothetical protein